MADTVRFDRPACWRLDTHHLATSPGGVEPYSAKPLPHSGSSSLLAGVGENDGRAVGEQRLRGWGFCRVLRPL